MQRRTLMAASAAALAFPALAQPQSKTPLSNAALAPNPAEFRKAMADFTQGRKPLAEGLHLDVPTLADNPAAPLVVESRAASSATRRPRRTRRRTASGCCAPPRAAPAPP